MDGKGQQNKYNSKTSDIHLRIKRLCEDQGISLYRLAIKSGIPYTILHRLANGQTSGIQFSKLGALAAALNVKPSELIRP